MPSPNDRCARREGRWSCHHSRAWHVSGKCNAPRGCIPPCKCPGFVEPKEKRDGR